MKVRKRYDRICSAEKSVTQINFCAETRQDILNGGYTGGYAIPKGGGAMKNYIYKAIRAILLVIVFIIVFAIKAE